LIHSQISFSGDRNSITIEPLPESDENHIPDDMGKLTTVDKARIGRVRSLMLKYDIHFFN